MVKKLLIFFMLLAMAIPLMAGEKTVTISRNEGIYDDGTGVYYCTKGGVTMTFSSGLNNVNYLVEHQQVVFDIFTTNYVIKKIKFNCLDNTLEGNMDCFYWGPSTISELGAMATYVPTGSYTWSGYIGTWVGGSTPSKYVKFVTRGKPVRFGSVEITYDKEFGDIYDLVTSTSELKVDSSYVLVSQRDSRALGKEEYHSNDDYTTFSSTPVTLLNNNLKVKITDEVQLIKLQQSTSSNRPWLLKVGDNYIRRRNGTYTSGSGTNQGYNLFSVATLPTYETDLYNFRVSISFGNNNNALISYYHGSGDTFASGRSLAIRHYNGGDLFRVMDWSTANSDATYQRVYLYKPAQNYEVTTECIPSNGGYITLGDGVLTDAQGKNWSQHLDNVSFFVGPTEGWGVGTVTVTDLNSRAVTTLQPTSTSDFGNDYSFEMPANNVHITANFLQPYNIDTICDPANGGQFNFINGYTNFSGQYYSNEGKTVTFKPTAADGYIFNSVTITDNGVTTTMTPDANGVYSFVMPGNAVTLTANFEEAHDLYLLGTANGRTNWIPSGPKFTFDGTNNKYYIDVYFKGGNDDPNTDPAYGYFSLTKKIDEGGVWDNIAGFRLAAENNNTWVEDGYTGVHLYGDRPNNAFKIKPGVYRIEVNPEMTEMSIIEYPLTVTFTPASGTVVDAGDVVSFTSNLNDLVHGINSQEVQATFNSYDNWGVTTSDSTHTITHDGITTVTGQSKIGYITATGTADYEIVGDLYLLGTANGMNSWQPYGPKFTYDAATETYTLDVYFSGLNVTAADEGYGYFSLSSVISNPNNPNWNDIPNSARWNAQYDDFPISGLAYSQSVTESIYQTNPNYAFKIDPGVYTITVNKGKTEMTVTKHELTLTFDPVSGTTVAAGDPVNIYSNLEQVVHAINPDEPLHATIQYATSTDGTLPTPNTQGSTVNITAEGATTTVNAQASLGYIVVPGNANYTVPAPTVYNITTQVTPSDAGTISVTSGAVAGETVTFTVTTNSGYQLDNVDVTYGYSQALLDYTYDPTTGQYSFIMPNDDVKIFADFARKNLYMLGSIMCRNTWRPAGPMFTYDTENEEYYLDVYFKGNEVADSYHNHFSLATEISDFDWTNSNNAVYATNEQWAQVSGRLVAAATNTPVGDGSTVSLYPMADGMTAANAAENSFEIEPGVYRITVNKEMTEMSIVQTPLHLFFDPVSGTTVQWGAVVKVTSDIDDYVQPIANRWGINEIHQSFTTKTDDPQSYHFDCDTAVIIKAGMTPVMATASVNFIHVVDTAYYYILGPYNINTVCNPAGAGSITINGGNTAVENQPVTFTVSTANPLYSVTDVVLTYVDENDVTQTFTLTPDENGVYSFVMPGVDVTVTANFYIPPKHNIYVEILPSNVVVGAVEGLPSPAEAMEGQTVTFRVRDIEHPEYNYMRYVVRLITNDTQDTTTLTSDNDRYSFVMPSEDVTIQVIYARGYTVTATWSPEDGGSVGIESTNGLVTSAEKYTYDTVTFHVTPNAGYEIASVSSSAGSLVPITDNGDGTYSFVMPSNNLTIIAHFQPTGDYQINVVNDPAEGGSATLSGYLKIEDGNYYSNERMSVIITPSAAYHWEVTGVDAVDSDNNPVDVDANGDGTYTLIMPASDVTVTAHYILSPYNIITRVNGSGEIVLTGEAADKNEYAGQTVTFGLVPGDGYMVKTVKVTYGTTTQTIDVTDNGDGTYSFVMPASDVMITATFRPAYTVSTVCIPAEGGTVVITSGVTGNLAFPGDVVMLTPTAYADYDVRLVRVRNNETDAYYTVYDFQDGTYAFEMPSANVTVEVYFGKKYTISTVCDPTDGGEIELNQYDVEEGVDGVYAFAGKLVHCNVTSYDGYVLESVTVTNHTTNEVTELMSDDEVTDYTAFSFEMPDADVTLTAHFAVGYKVTCIVNPEDGGDVACLQELDNGYVIVGDYLIPGQTVKTLINIAPGYVFKSATVTLDDHPEQEVTLIDDGSGMNWDDCSAYYDKHFVMPEADVTVTVNVEPYTPLRVIEHNFYEKANNGDTVVVMDDLVVVWAAKDYLWAKDLAESNYSVPLPDDEEALNTYANVDVRDYVKDDLDFQKHEWDQSNWVILDCSGLYPNITNVTERRKKLDDYVDHMIAGRTIKGVYQIPTIPDVDPTHIWFFGKFNHVIKLTEEPEIKDKAEPSKGYPGYMQDPREENKAFDYHYNHYIPTTFFAFNRSDIHSLKYTFEPGPKAVQWSSEEFDNLAIFILPPQDQEVAQVWAVYAGADTIEENGSTKLVDKFTVYEYYLDGYTSQNVYDLPGGFAVPAENWIYNRLNSGYTDESYGRPGKYDNEQTGSTKLMQDTAYLFHIAIKTMPYVKQLPEMRGPNKPAAFQESKLYQIYPLDMDTHDGTVTANRVIWEVDPASREVESVRYYNVMGQESKTPFDGINIVVTRYTDGSASSKKIYR